MSKPVLLSGGNGKVSELAGTNDNDVLTWDSTLEGGSWKAAAGGGGGSTVTMGGDVTGSSDNATVVSIQNNSVSTTAPTTGKILQYTGTEWAPADVPQGGSGGGGVVYYFNRGTVVSGGNLPANTYQLGRSAEAAQTSVALTNLATTSWTRVGGFVTNASDPSVTTVPAGLWDFNLWAYTTAAANNQAYLRLTLYAYDGSTNPESGTALAQTDNMYLYDANVTAQYIASMLIAGGTTLPSTSTRLYLLVEAKASTSNRDVTVYFGNGTPSHTHSTIPTVGATGIVHVVDGVFQSPASPVTLSSNDTGGDVTGVLKLANGGTNANLTAIAGGAVYGTGTALAVTGAGSAGTVLVSAGTSAPSFTTIGGAAFGSQTAKYVLAAPSASNDNPSFRQLTTSDITSFSSNAVTSLTGTANQVLVNSGTTAVAGDVTLTLPQSIGTSNSPSFTGLTLSGLNVAGFVKNSAAGLLSGGNAVDLSTADVINILPTTKGGTGAGTAAFPTINTVFAGASSGSTTLPSFRSLVAADLPVVTIAKGGTNNASLVVTQGTVYYGDGTKLVGLAPGTSGQVLQTQGASANPQWAGVPYDLSAASAGTYTNSQVIFRYIAPRAVTLTSTGSYFKCLTASSGTVTVAVAQSGSATTSFNVTFSVVNGLNGSVPAGTTIIMAAGDILTVTMPTSADSTLAGVYFTLKGTGV